MTTASPGEVVARGAADIRRAITAANAAGRAALVVYLPAGFPDLATSRACLEAAAEGGADLLEVGFPYSDPLMDGPVIQGANQVALEAGYTTDDDFALCAELTAAVDVPALVMTYVNLAWHHGGTATFAKFAGAAAQAGLSGVILPDLPAQEGAEWGEVAAGAGLGTVYLAAPTSTDVRLEAIARASTGFVYATSTLGVTGVRQSLSQLAAPLVQRLRDRTDAPVCVGVGVSDPAQAAEVATFADGVIVGTAAVRAAGEGGPDAVRRFVADLREAVAR